MITLILLFLTQVPTTTSAATLDEAFRSALIKNEMVEQSREKVVQAEEVVNKAWSGPLPVISLQATHLIQPLLPNPTFREFSPEHQTTTSAQLKQPIFSGFREFAYLRGTKDLLESAKQDRITAMLNLYERVATAYWNVLALEQDLRNLNEQTDIYARRVRDLQARGRRGESASYDALTAQASEAVLQSNIAVVSGNLKSARETLNFETGLSADSSLVDADEKAFSLKPLEHYLSRIEERPDVRAAKSRVEAADEQVSFAKGSHWGVADVVGNYYFDRPGFAKDLHWDIQLRYTLPIYEGGLRMAETRENSSKQREATLELNKLRRQADSQIRSLHENIKQREGQLKALQRATDLAQKYYQVLLRESRRGLTKNVEVQVALTEYGNARRTYDQARFAVRLDRIKLESAAVILPPSLEGSLK